MVHNKAGIFPKRGIHGKISAHDASSYECDKCGQILTSRIGLISHCRTHITDPLTTGRLDDNDDNPTSSTEWIIVLTGYAFIDTCKWLIDMYPML